MSEPYFLPYQRAWIEDGSRFKIAEKSRRVGLTYAQSYEDVRDAARQDGSMDVWFSSADESAAKEYIHYCGQWAKILDIAARDLGEIVVDGKNDIKALAIELANGRRIHGLTSNPKAFRSKGGKLVLDEFAFHADQDGMWRAARPIITWGYPVRIISTLNGKGNRYFRMLDQVRKDVRAGRKPMFSLHQITIVQAVAQGLADKIVGRKLTPAEREAWLEEERRACGDEDTWRQEYLCEALDDASAWLGWDLIVKCEHDDAGKLEHYAGGECFVGFDIARRRDLSIIWVIERVGDVRWTRRVIRMSKKKFAEQLDAFDAVMKYFNVRRACVDQTGMGEPIVEELQARHGKYRVEGVLFNAAVKQDMAIHGKQCFEDALVRIPPDPETREAHHAVKKLVTAAGNARFDAERTEAGHADEFWAHMLALHAAQDSLQPAAGSNVEAGSGIWTPSRAEGRRRMRMFATP